MTKRYQHESYGNITVTRASSSGTFLFGSDAVHHHFVHVELSAAEMERDLSHNWLHGRKRIAEFWMTESQWAHFVSSFGDGTGTPVTLRYADGRGLEQCPKPDQWREQFSNEIKERVEMAIDGLKTAESSLREALKPGNKTLGKKELHEILSAIDSAILQVTRNLPYVEKCFNESMDQKMTDAKIEFESIVARRLQELGLESLRKQLPEEIEPPLALTGGQQ